MYKQAKISNIRDTDGRLTFTLKGVDRSIANAIRRTILTDIPTIVFRTMPYELDQCDITENTTNLNNEILKHRLSCIPIHMKNVEQPLQHLQLELDMENTTDTFLTVTSEHFKIKNTANGDYVEKSTLKTIFPPYIPPDGRGEYFIEFVRLRPKVSEEIPGGKIRLTCGFSVGTAREWSGFNVVSKISYGDTQDQETAEAELQKQMEKWRGEGKNKKEVDFEADNWRLLDGRRYVIRNSFDFVVQSIGVFTNGEILAKACDVLYERCNELVRLLETGSDNEIDSTTSMAVNNEQKILIAESSSKSTIPNSYDIRLSMDHTMGCMLTYMLNTMYYEPEEKIMSYVGYYQAHPHNKYIYLRIAFMDSANGKQQLIEYVSNAVSILKELVKDVGTTFQEHFVSERKRK